MIRIIDDWYVTVDSYPINYCVRYGKCKKDAKGKWTDKPKGYFGSLRNAIKEIRRLMISEHFSKGERTLEDAFSTISKIDERFEKLMEKLDA